MELRALNCDPAHMLQNIRCFALDMDGTIYLGEQWIPGAQGFLAEVLRSGREYFFLTNNSSKGVDAYVQKLAHMGLETERRRVVTSGIATIAFLKEHYASSNVFLLGNETLSEEFSRAGIRLVQTGADVVVTAFDTTLDYAKMCTLCDYVRGGLPYIATHPDSNCPTESGFIPDIGAIHAFVEESTGRRPDQIIGKPNRAIIDFLLNRSGTTAQQTAMVGDRLYTDIAVGVAHGLCSILVLSGETKAEELKDSPVQPHLVFDSLREVTPLL